MLSTVLNRWEDFRDLTSGPKSHLKAVADFLETHPAVIYHGDSWFSTPLYPNLARQSAEAIDGIRMIVGKPGAQAKELFDRKSVQTFARRIADLPFDVLCLSAGGNDLLGDRLIDLFKLWHDGRPAKISAADAFDRIVSNGAFARLRGRYALMLDALLALKKRERPKHVIGHSYVPLHRIGQAGGLTIDNIGLIAILKGDVGPWLYGPMKRVLASPVDAKVFADLLLVNGFKETVLAPLKQQYDGFFDYVDLAQANLNQTQDWYDEIHPTAAGFAQCKALLNAALRAALPQKAGKIA
ncbi:hypothetical protein C7S18_18870 [Ahniella affigens]|uniref:SGNH hydrolase-type esterase domain-containing protein n=1 Tax=Ahniella affigens TaxID=2021234 RepID=A0A2P1PWE3_9GAMM|nr:hypothetical protein [Ahniella affigens]AVP99104.1 hypothetical protein C7S18_18870 [Ahniella affigens]